MAVRDSEEKNEGLEKGSWQTYEGGGSSEEGTDKLGSQLLWGEATPTNHSSKSLPFAPSSELVMF